MIGVAKHYTQSAQSAYIRNASMLAFQTQHKSVHTKWFAVKSTTTHTIILCALLCHNDNVYSSSTAAWQTNNLDEIASNNETRPTNHPPSQLKRMYEMPKGDSASLLSFSMWSITANICSSSVFIVYIKYMLYPSFVNKNKSNNQINNINTTFIRNCIETWYTSYTFTEAVTVDVSL